MVKIYRYELKRYLSSAVFLIMSGLTAAYGLYVILTTTLYGAYAVAPYSPWSFLGYITALSPFLCGMAVYSVSQLYSEREKNVRNVVAATPVKLSRQIFLKTLAIATGFLLASLLITAILFYCYARFFDYYAWAELLLLGALVLLPQLLFTAGAGIWLAKVHPGLAYALIALLILMNFITLPLPYAVDFLGNSIVVDIGDAGSLIQGVIAFRLPIAYLLSRLGFGMLGIGGVALACLKEDGKK